MCKNGTVRWNLLNLAWSLVEDPKGVKSIGSKLIYKKKSLSKPCVDVDVKERKRPMDGEMKSMGSNLVCVRLEKILIF